MHDIITIKPYDYESAEEVFRILFSDIEHETEKGFTEIPAASYQLVVSALELIKWDAETESERNAIKAALGLVEHYRDVQKRREWKREKEATT